MSLAIHRAFFAERETIGSRLHSARLASNLTLIDVSERTKISLRHLEAIESDNFSSLPGRVYVFGFTKAFAQVVGVDSESVVSALRDSFDARAGFAA